MILKIFKQATGQALDFLARSMEPTQKFIYIDPQVTSFLSEYWDYRDEKIASKKWQKKKNMF